MNPSLILGAVAAVVGAACGGFVSHTATGADWGTFWLWSALSAFATTAFFWWLFMERRQRYGVLRGILVGALSGALAHYVCWLLQIAAAGKMGPLDALTGALSFTFFCLLVMGWITVPSGALMGGIYARIRRSQAAKAAPSSP